MLLALVVPCEGSAGTVLADLAADYVPGVNPGDTVMPSASGSGQWRYLASETLNPTDAGASLADLQWDTTGQLFERPGVNHTDGFSEDALRLVTNVLLMHPAHLLGDVVVARWIAGPGEEGQVDIVGNVAKGDPGGGDGIRFLVFVDGVSLLDEVVAFDDTVGIPFALHSVAIAEGSTTDFVVSKIGDSFFDTTFVTAVITPAPEPTSTSTTSPTSTSSSTSSSSSSTSATVASTTSTSSSSSTTVPPGECDRVPVGPTFESIACRLADLRADTAGQPAVGAIADKLLHALDKAIERNGAGATFCADGNTKEAKKQLKKVVRQLIQYSYRLRSRASRRKIDAQIREPLAVAADVIQGGARTLRTSLDCTAGMIDRRGREGS